MLLLASAQYMWHVSKLGNDSNDGRANAYPVDLAGRAKLTIGAAVSAASSGDTIIIWPGTYTEKVTINNKALSIIGAGAIGSVILNPADTTFEITGTSSGTKITNITGITTTAGKHGLYIAPNNTDIVIDFCKFSGPNTGILLSGTTKRIKITNTYTYSNWDGLDIQDADKLLVENCVCESVGGSTYNCRGLSSGNCVGVVIKDTRFIASRTALTTLQAAAAENSGSGIIQFDNCSFALSGSNPSTDAADSCLFAAVKNLTSGSMIFDNCIFSNGITRTFIYGLYLAGSSRAVLNNSFFAGANAANTITGLVTATVAGHERDYFRDSTKSGVNDIYNAYKLTWTSGANNGESKYVNDYIGADREFRFADNFTNNIQVGDMYTIVSCTGGVVYLTGTANAILNNSRFLQSSTDTLYHVFVNSGCNAVVNNSLYTPTLVGGSGTIKEYL
jgi:hypothetical protein